MARAGDRTPLLCYCAKLGWGEREILFLLYFIYALRSGLQLLALQLEDERDPGFQSRHISAFMRLSFLYRDHRPCTVLPADYLPGHALAHDWPVSRRADPRGRGRARPAWRFLYWTGQWWS